MRESYDPHRYGERGELGNSLTHKTNIYTGSADRQTARWQPSPEFFEAGGTQYEAGVPRDWKQMTRPDGTDVFVYDDRPGLTGVIKAFSRTIWGDASIWTLSPGEYYDCSVTLHPLSATPVMGREFHYSLPGETACRTITTTAPFAAEKFLSRKYGIRVYLF
jgi:hypothetical protein